jgi:hypothetical protein
MKAHRDWLGRTVALLITLLGVGLMVACFYLAYQQFTTPPRDLMTNPHTNQPDLPSIATGVWASIPCYPPAADYGHRRRDDCQSRGRAVFECASRRAGRARTQRTLTPCSRVFACLLWIRRLEPFGWQLLPADGLETLLRAVAAHFVAR